MRRRKLGKGSLENIRKLDYWFKAHFFNFQEYSLASTGMFRCKFANQVAEWYYSVISCALNLGKPHFE
jgi:hypothetical protein